MRTQDIDKLSYNEVVKFTETMDKEPGSLDTYRISFLRNITVDLMMPYLKFLCYKTSLHPEIDIGNYDTVLQDISGPIPGADYAASDLIVICLHPRVIAAKLYNDFSGIGAEDVEREIAALLGYMDKVLTEVRKRSSAPILLHNFEIPAYPAYGILDYQDAQRQINVIRRVNQEILRLAGKHKSVYVIDMDLLQSRIGYSRFNDERFWHMGRAPYSRDGYLAITKEYMKFIRALKGKNKKCLILDCDNTLWGGIIGEDGIGGIKIGHTYPGSSYREFQETVLGLYRRGVLLALCSRNNQADIEEVLEKHPDMILRKEHFVVMKINWKDKVSNIKEIAKELDIGIDSLVFVDDSEFEISLVDKMMPEATVFLLPQEPSSFRSALEEQGFFDTLHFSEEDRKRTEMYKAEAKRKETKAQFSPTDIEEYLKYIEMKVMIGRADHFYIPRISQLTQRTNQFNLTAKRYSESEIADLVKNRDRDVFYVSLSDRFGDSGVVGAVVMFCDGSNAFIDVFLLSCRAIGRGIEDVMLKVCIDEARQRGCDKIFGLYVPTKKNQQAEKFYERNRFAKAKSESGGLTYELSLSVSHMAFPAYFKLIKVGDVEFLKGD